jgi:RecT family protein
MGKDVAVKKATNVQELETIQPPKLVERFSARFGVDADKFLETLKNTAFRQRPAKEGKQAIVVTNEHLMMLLIIAEQYHLNPLTGELFAFPREGSIVPVISVDGWIRCMNEHPQFDCIELAHADETVGPDDFWFEATITRKDRSKPIVIREYLKECFRDTDPWNSHPKRMLRHKAIIQCCRVAFGFAGVYDPDEAERVYANAIDVTPRGPTGKPETRAPQAKQVPAADPPPAMISMDQATMLADKLKEEGVALNLLLAKFEIGSLEELPVANFDAAIACIDEASKAGAA